MINQNIDSLLKTNNPQNIWLGYALLQSQNELTAKEAIHYILRYAFESYTKNSDQFSVQFANKLQLFFEIVEEEVAPATVDIYLDYSIKNTKGIILLTSNYPLFKSFWMNHHVESFDQQQSMAEALDYFCKKYINLILNEL